MVHARQDYNRFQDPAQQDASLLSPGSTPVGKDEPVMLFRAKDRHFVQVLEHYAKLLRTDPEVEDHMVKAVQDHILLAQTWRYEHGTKSPDMPKEPSPNE